MLAYADATGDQRVSIAVKRAVNRTMDGYPIMVRRYSVNRLK